MKLQQAYISESVAVCNWHIIGYKAPGTNTKGGSTGGAVASNNNFNYADGGSYTNNSAALGTTAVVGFKAHNKVNLNDCTGNAAMQATANWSVSVKAGGGSSEGDAEFVATTQCPELTSNFTMIGK